MKQIFDAFGTKVKIGDWVIYPSNYKTKLKIGKIVEFTNGSNPKVTHVLYGDDILSIEPSKLRYNLLYGAYIIAVQSAFVKCTDQVLIETLEKLIK